MTNTGSGTVTSYQVGSNGSLALISGAAASTGAGSLPIDVTASANGYLYVLNEASGEIDVFRIGQNGALTALASIDNLPAFAAGIAQR